MAEKRMFSQKITDSDAFLDMPQSTQNLYFHLNMHSDDDGFNNSPSKIMRMCTASKNDMDLLILKHFVIPFESGICVIKHWRIHNCIQKDRYKPTVYKDEKEMLEIKENGAYKLVDTECIQDVSELDTQYRLDKIRLELDKNSIEVDGEEKSSPIPSQKSKRFIPPTVEEVMIYCQERNNSVNAEKFVDYYTSNGWKVGKNSMKDWKASVRTWEQKDGAKNGTDKQSTKGLYTGEHY